MQGDEDIPDYLTINNLMSTFLQFLFQEAKNRS